MDSGKVGDPGLPAPSPVLERMEFLGRNLEDAGVLRLNTGGRNVIQLGLKRSSPVQENGAASLPVHATPRSVTLCPAQEVLLTQYLHPWVFTSKHLGPGQTDQCGGTLGEMTDSCFTMVTTWNIFR